MADCDNPSEDAVSQEFGADSAVTQKVVKAVVFGDNMVVSSVPTVGHLYFWLFLLYPLWVIFTSGCFFCTHCGSSLLLVGV